MFSFTALTYSVCQLAAVMVRQVHKPFFENGKHFNFHTNLFDWNEAHSHVMFTFYFSSLTIRQIMICLSVEKTNNLISIYSMIHVILRYDSSTHVFASFFRSILNWFAIFWPTDTWKAATTVLDGSIQTGTQSQPDYKWLDLFIDSQTKTSITMITT